MQSTRSFKEHEWACKCARCKQVTPHKMQAHVMEQVQAIRDEAGRPLSLTSAYRCPQHPEEAKKAAPGQHSLGLAVDIKVIGGAQRYEIIQLGLKHGATGIGVAKDFVHLDWRAGEPMAWQY